MLCDVARSVVFIVSAGSCAIGALERFAPETRPTTKPPSSRARRQRLSRSPEALPAVFLRLRSVGRVLGGVGAVLGGVGAGLGGVGAGFGGVGGASHGGVDVARVGAHGV